MLVSDDGTIEISNARLERIFGYGAGELNGESVDALVPPAARPHHHELRDAYGHLPTIREMGKGRNLFGVNKNGELIPVEVGLHPLIVEQRSMVLVSVLDLTERANAEHRLRLALDAVSTAVVMVDEHGEIVLTNEVAERQFGYRKEELLGQAIEILIPSETRRKHQVYRTSYTADSAPRTMGSGLSLSALRKDGSKFPVEIGLTPIKTGKNEKRIMSTIIDLTERHQHEQEIKLANEKLTFANTELSQFAYSASHDLKAPLASMSGLLSLIIDDIDNGEIEEARENANKSKALAERLRTRIEDTLAIAKADHGVVHKNAIDLHDLLQHAVSSVISGENREDLIIELELQHTLALHSNAAMLSSIFENLISNAIKYSDPNKRHTEINIASKDKNRSIVLTIQDNGTGIPTDKFDEVFKMFTRFSQHNDGAGLGLALVHKYINLLDGEITFDSSKEGTIFTISFPAETET